MKDTHLIGSILCLLMIATCTDRKVTMESSIQEIVARSEGTIAIAFEDLVTGKTFFLNETIQMHAASTMKTPVMIEVYKQAHQGKFTLDNSLIVENRFSSIIDGSVYAIEFNEEDKTDPVFQAIGKALTIYDLVYNMITVSSNLATNILMELVGAENVMQTMKEIGANHIHVLRGVEDIKAYRAGLNNTTDAYDMLLIMKAIAQKKIVSEDACNQMIEILSSQQYREKIPALLPETVKVANKTGHITEIDHDAAIVYPSPNHPYILVILTQGIKSHQEAQQVCAKISKIIYDVVEKSIF